MSISKKWHPLEVMRLVIKQGKSETVARVAVKCYIKFVIKIIIMSKIAARLRVQL
jgi:hypothetical protein